MSSKDKGDEDISCFALDGVVAEMVIEVEENEQQSKGQKKKDENLTSKDDSENESTSASKKKTHEELKKEALSKTDSKAEAQSKTRSSGLKSEPSQPSPTTNLKRSNKAGDSSEDENEELPVKKLKSSSAENTPKKSKSSVTFSPVATEVDSAKRTSLRKTTILKTAQTPSKSTTIGIATSATCKIKPDPDESTPATSKIKPDPDESTPASNKAAPASSKAAPTSSKTPLASGKVKPVSTAKKSKLKAWHLDPETMYRSLESFSNIKKRVNKAELKILKSLHRILYNKMLPNGVLGKDLKREILKFSGFPFRPYSEEHEKRRKILEKLPCSTFAEIATTLDKKNDSMYGVMSFLMRPCRVVYCAVDPFHPTMQPELKLHKITLVKQSAARKQSSAVTSTPKKKSKPKCMKQPLQLRVVKKPISSDIQIRRRALELAIEIQETVIDINDEDESALEPFEYEIKEEVVTEDESENQEKSTEAISVPENQEKSTEEYILPDHPPDTTEENSKSECEITLSADEEKDDTQNAAPSTKRPKPTFIPLKSFPSIKENIFKNDFSALQRLHIVLFGASNKASNLRNNLLSFGGFSFYEGSEEWKEKEFLLSLLSQSTLKEYLDILDIKYREGVNQGLLIKKLMKFCAAPIGKLTDDIEDDDDIEVVSMDEIVPIETPKSPKRASVKKAEKRPVVLPKKKLPKKMPEVKGTGPQHRKVLMDEAQVRCLEADLAREQRILKREKKLHEDQAKLIRLGQLAGVQSNKSKHASLLHSQLDANYTTVAENNDKELLNALLETVYQRRELKKAGKKVSIPNKGGHTRLGELPNVKFLVCTANYNDLDVLHHLIYMSEAPKSRVSKNIFDFAGFNFTEESPAYQDRMNFLTSLGYDISQRIAFWFGLCPNKTLIAQQDLNELILYFLMSPSQSKQIPIRHSTFLNFQLQTFCDNKMPVELSGLGDKHSGDLEVSPVKESTPGHSNQGKNTFQTTASLHQPSPSQGQRRTEARAKKYFKSPFNLSKMRGLKPSISTLPLKTPKKLVNPTTVSQTPTPSSATPTPSRLFTQHSIKIPTTPEGAPAQEFYIQQQTPDGQQKMFKLVKLPPTHPLSNISKTPAPVAVPAVPQIPLTITPPVISAPGLPPGLIVFKNNPALSSAMPLSLGQSTSGGVLIPNVAGLKPLMPKVAVSTPAVAPKPAADAIEVLPEEKEESVPDIMQCNYSSDEAEALHPLEEDDDDDEPGTPPTEDELYDCIQDIIHSCHSLEDITLKNVISRVTAKYPNFDLTQTYFMKECVKKILMGT